MAGLLAAVACGDNQPGAPDAAAIDAAPACAFPIFGIAATGCDFAAQELPMFLERRYRVDADAGEVVRGGSVIATFEVELRGELLVIHAERLEIEADAIVEVAARRPVILAIDGAARIDGALVVDGAVDGAGSAAADCGDRAFGFGGQMAGAGGRPGGAPADPATVPIPDAVRAGCPSFDPISAQQARPGGGLQLSSGAPVALAGSVSAMGEGGAGGDGAVTSGGAGGASGGVVVIDAPGALTGALCADGGGGGGGSGDTAGSDGQSGETAACGQRATGGFGAGGAGGDGSGGGDLDGGAGATTGIGAPGGGGGAAGYLLISADFDASGGSLSPPGTPLP